MRRPLTGYAGAFNRRHRRQGHLFQNRYKSIVVEEDPYLRELTRYIHLNPLRAGVVRDLKGLARYPWGGHSAMLWRVGRPWQAVDEVLGHCAPTRGPARRQDAQFVAEGVAVGRRPALQGGGLRRSAGGWAGVAALRRGRERWAAAERVLGSGPFVERLLRETAAPPLARAREAAGEALPRLVKRIAGACGIRTRVLMSGSRRRPVAQARPAVGAVAVTGLGLTASHVTRALGVTPMAIRRGIDRGLEHLRARHLQSDRLAQEVLRKVE